MSDYSETMKSEDASVHLRRATENAALGGPEVPLNGERFFEDFVLLIFPLKDGWAVGLRVDFTSDTWSIAELVAIPSESATAFPTMDTEGIQSYVDNAVSRARGRKRAAVAQLEKLGANEDFIQERFDTWRDKKAARTSVEYAALAAKYAEQVRMGNSRATATLAELVEMSPSVMAQRIKEARRRSLLSRGERGRASGALTPLGALFLDPQFPGMHRLRREGMTMAQIADKYGISERLVWAGLEAEYATDGALLSDDDFVPPADRDREL